MHKNKVTYQQYHTLSMQCRDVDPGIIALQYIADRFELNMEQRFWLAFLYGCTYTATSVFYIYNEFPDYQNVDEERLQKWWDKNKSNVIFQTDRLRIKSNNQFVPTFQSYYSLVGNNQEAFFTKGLGRTPRENWLKIFERASHIKNFGRFSVFNFLDCMYRLTDINIEPNTLIMADASSCRDGVAFAVGKTELVGKALNHFEMAYLQSCFDAIRQQFPLDNIFQIETTLCAYKKYMLDKRWIGYYIERMRQEIVKMERIPGVCWDVLWEFRKETFQPQYLREVGATILTTTPGK